MSGEIGDKASEMASQIELTARDLVRVGKEVTSLAGALASKVASVVGNSPEESEGAQISDQAHEVAEAVKRTSEDALRIAQKAVEMAEPAGSLPGRLADRGGETTPSVRVEA